MLHEGRTKEKSFYNKERKGLENLQVEYKGNQHKEEEERENAALVDIGKEWNC